MRVHQIFIIIENAPDGFLRFQLIDPGSKEFFQNPVVDLFSDIISSIGRQLLHPFRHLCGIVFSNAVQQTLQIA